MAAPKRLTGSLRATRPPEQELDDDDDSAGSGAPLSVNMSFLSNVTSYVDGSGVGHVKVNDTMDWSEILRNDSTVHIIYAGSGSSEEILLFRVNETDPQSVSASGSSGTASSSGSMAANSTVSPIDRFPTGSSASDSSTDDDGVGTSSPTTLVIVASILAIIAVVAVFAVVVYGRRNRRRAFSDEPSNPDEPFIVGHLPHQPAPQLSLLDTDITPDQWVEGQYQYSPNMSGLQNSLSGTAILSDNRTTPSHHRLTVDASTFSRTNRRDRQRDEPLEDIPDHGRRRIGTTPVVLYESNSIEERKTNSSRPSQRQQQQWRTSRRDKYATRRDR